MEAANRGVRDAMNERSKSYGLPILLPRSDEVPNKHLDIKSEHKRFSSRLDEFMRLSHAVVVAQGGIGTLLELFYVWQLLQVGLLDRRPVALLGKQFWSGLIAWMREQQLGKGFISAHDFENIQIVDSVEEVVALLREEQLRFEASRAVRPPDAVEGARSKVKLAVEGVLSELEQAQTLPDIAAARTGPRGD
jgi:predicted Rossmann-fold nucleotide-binding protein